MHRFLISIILLISLSGESQNPLGISATAHLGWIMPHHPYMAILDKGHTRVLEIDIIKQTTGKTTWETHYNYPIFGLGTMFFDFSNPEMVGYGISAFPFLNFPITNHHKWQWYLKFGYGIGYLTKTFDAKTNFKNSAIGSHLNAFIHLNSQLRFQISKKIDFFTGVSFSHFSNGAFKTPNLGINIPAINAGIHYFFKERPALIKNDTSSFSKTSYNLLIFSGGLKEIMPYNGAKYSVFNIRYSRIFNLTKKTTIGLGVEINNNSANKELYKRLYDKNNNMAQWQAGVTAQYYLELGATSLFFNFGAYLYNPYKALSPFFHRIGGIHKIYKNWYFNLSLRTHFAVADNIEFGIAYKW